MTKYAPFLMILAGLMLAVPVVNEFILSLVGGSSMVHTIVGVLTLVTGLLSMREGEVAPTSV